MGFIKTTQGESFKVEVTGKISQFLQKLGKKSVTELTDEERQQLQDEPNTDN